MRLIDGDALIDDLMERYCKECNKRKGIKNGKYRIIYEIGEVPCRACEVDDVKAELEEAPTIDAEEVVRCKDCIHAKEITQYGCSECVRHCEKLKIVTSPEWFCAEGRKKDETALQD